MRHREALRRIALVGMVAVVALPLLWIPGFVLANDSVAVPNQPLLPWMWGAGTAPPRSVPQDAVVAVVDNLIPGWLLQRLLIVAALLLLGFGVGRLLRGQPTLPRLCAATVAVWSTFVFERMAMGHWGLLLGVAVMPWVIDATADARRGAPGAVPRAVAWAALGSLVPTAGILQVLAIAGVIAWPGPRRIRPSAMVLAGALALQLVWIIPGIQHPGTATAQAADVFGLRAEGSAGPLLTALATGGIWNSAAMPASRAGVMAIVAAVVLLAAAAAGARQLRSLPGPIAGPLAVLASLGLVWAVMTAVPVLSPAVDRIERLPGGGLLRDAQKWLAPWLLLLAMSAGLGLARLAGRLRRADARWPGLVLAVLVPVLLLPDLAFGMWGRLQPVQYPDEWAAVSAELAAGDEAGDAVSWPWSTFRSYEWNDHRTSLDPAPRYVPRTVVTDSRLLVQQGADLVVVPGDDPRSTAVGEALRQADPAPRLADLGIGWILLQSGQPATPGYPVELPESLVTATEPVLRSGSLELRRLAGVTPVGGTATAPLIGAWLLWALVVVGSTVVVMGQLMPSRPARARRRDQPSAKVRGTEIDRR